jgi:Auxiliary Activity family 9 (formerly GH61)
MKRIDKWANEIAAENGNEYTVKLPSDIKSGTYILRTELIALHGNMANLNTTSLAGPQFYPYCVNIDIINGGSSTPEGVNIPGAYKPTDYGVAFSPFMTYSDSNVGDGTVQNSKYVSSPRLLAQMLNT